MVLACDFFISVTAGFRVLSVFVVLDVGMRRILHWNVTEHPTADWTVQQFRMAITGEYAHRYLVHDRDGISALAVDAAVTWMGLRVLKTSVRAPAQQPGPRSARAAARVTLAAAVRASSPQRAPHRDDADLGRTAS